MAALAHYSLDAFELDNEDSGYKYGFNVTVDASLAGQTVDFVLGVKQANNSFMAYLFEDITLGIDGEYNNFWQNGGGREVNDFSFAAGFVRDSTPVTVPEPGALALLGLGLLGLGASHRQRRAA